MTQESAMLTASQTEELERIVREVLNFDRNFNIDNLAAVSCPSWDSLRHVELALRVQNFFKIKFTSAEMLSMRSMVEMKRLVARHVNLPGH